MSKYFYQLIMFLMLLWLQNAFAANSPPVLDAIATPQSIVLANTLTFTITATDPDGDKLSFRIENAPSGASTNYSSGAFSWRPSKAGSYSATAVVTDNGSPSQNDKQTFNITVNPAKCPTQSQIPNAECDTLVAIYNETGGPNWRNIYNWTKTNTPCTWEGVACSGGRVTSLNLYYKNITGILPDLSALTALKSLNFENNQLTQVPNLSALTALESINLKSNRLTQIPDVSNLTALKSLELYNNQITVVPDFSDLTALETLNLQSNRITQVPDFSNLTALKTLNVASNSLTVVPDFSNLTTLETLNLSSNQLSQVPDFSNLANLKTLYLSSNIFTQAIDFSNLTYLLYLDFSGNQLTQTPDFSNLTTLETLNLNSNQLTQVPDFSNLANLTNLYLSSNRFTQIIDFSNLTSLSSLSLDSNKLTEVPDFNNLSSLSSLSLGSNQLTQVPDFSNLSSLSYLYLSSNQLTQVPDFSNLTSLSSLSLGFNQLTQVPDFSNLSSLSYLDLSSNQLSQVPDFSNLTSLQELNLQSNQLTTVPDFSNLTSLQNLYLHGNQLTTVPDFSALTALRYLYLHSNQITQVADLGTTALYRLELQGNKLTSIPNFSNLTSLQYLYLYSNQLTTVPDFSALTALRYLSLQSNQITQVSDLGTTALYEFNLENNKLTTVPNFSNLTSLQYLYLHNNQLATVPNFSNLTSLQYLYLHNNQLATVPNFSNLTSLQYLYVYNNKLSGNIPNFSNLTSLRYLYLQNNQLSGDIPSSLANLNNLSSLDLGYNKFTASDDNLIEFLKTKDSDWANTQTVPPSNVTATAVDADTIRISWTTIPFNYYSGHYQIKYSTTSGGPYTAASTTAGNKYTNNYNVNGLIDQTKYYFVVETYTAAHGNQQNALTSSFSAEVNATTPEKTADLQIIQSDSSDPVNIENQITYTLTVKNAGPNEAINVSLIDTLPSGITFISASGTGWTCNESSGTVTCTLNNLAVTSANPITIKATAPSTTGDISNQVEISSDTLDPDTTNNSVTETTTIVTNYEPINTIPTTNQTINEDSTLTFSTENSNHISIIDSDAGTNPVKVKLTTTNGTLTLSGNTGLTFITGTGTNDAEMVFTGTVTDINTALEGIIFNPNPQFYGDATVQIEIDDQSSFGALTDTDTINITINSVNDIPSFTKGADQTVNEDSGAQTIANWATNISAGPANELSQTLIFTVTNDNNSLFAVQPAIDTTGNLSFTSAANATGIAIVSVKIFDGIDTSAAQNFNISIQNVNDTPINIVPTIQAVNEDSTLIFSTENSNQIAITDSDAGTNPVKVKLTTTNGTLTLSGTTGLTFTIGTGTNDAEMLFTGTVTDINTALDGMIFNPTEEFYGDATIQIEVNDQSLTDTDTINITINPVNDIPSFTKGADQTVFVTGRQTIENWATKISAGPSNESSQTLIFTVTNNKNSLFAVQPAIDSTGNLSFTPTAAGSAVVTVVLNDGIDTSAAQTFNIKVNPLPASAPIQQTTSEPTGSSVGTIVNFI